MDEKEVLERLESLELQNGRLKIVMVISFLVMVFMVLGIWAYSYKNNVLDTVPNRLRLEELTVGSLNIAGPDSIHRIKMSYKIPQAPFQGKMIERTVPPDMAGLIYCAANGDEVGGIGVSGNNEGGHALITLDYRNVPLEALGMATFYDGQGNQGANFVVMENPSEEVDVGKIIAKDSLEIKKLTSMMIERVQLGVFSHNAALKLTDRNGKERIVIGVDSDNNPVLKVLGPDGSIQWEIPKEQ